MKMIFPFFLLIFFIWSANAATPENHHKINLEDIEHDNLINERRLQGKEPLEGQQTQHLRPPGIQYHSEYDTAAASPLQGGIVYVDAETQNEIEPEEENELTPQQSGGGHHQTAQVQYVTPEAPTQEYQQQYYSPHKVYGPPSAAATAAVHESSQTYAAPSRQTLIKPILPTVATFLQPHQQPQFVYVQTGQQQSRPQQSQTSEHVPKAQSYQYVSQHHLQQHQGGITYAHEGQNAVQQNTREEEQDYPQQQAPRNPNYLQYVPYVARGSSDSQAYIIMSAIPAGYKQSIEPSNIGPSMTTTYAKPVGQAAVRVIPYQPTKIPPSGPGVELHIPSENHGNTERDEEPTAPDAQQDIQYAAPNQYRPSSENSKQKLYAPKHPEKQEPEVHRQPQLPHHVAAQQSIQVVPLQSSQPVYVAPQVIHQQVQHPVGFGPSFDFFHGRQSKSLLDSYIPSWVIIQRSRAVDPSQQYARSFTPIATASSYNTIAYSVPQHAVQYSGGHFKQSTKVKA